MLSHEERSILRKNQLAEVICQFRFPEILIIGTNPPAQFQELIRDVFPKYSVRKETSSPNQAEVINHQFSSADSRWRVNLTSKFISLSCHGYHCWEDFAQMLDKPLAAFIQTYKPAYFERIGLRYLNFISRKSLDLDDVPFKELIHPCYLGPMAEDDVIESTIRRCTVDAQFPLRGGCTLNIHAGPGMVKRNGIANEELHFIFDQDLFMAGNIPMNATTGALNTLHRQAYSVFRGAITDTLFNAMEPYTC